MRNSFLSSNQAGKNQFWRYFVTSTLAVGMWVSATVIFLFVVFLLKGTIDLQELSYSLVLLITMLPFAFLLLGLWFGVNFIHRRSFISLINPLKNIRWSYIGISIILWLILAAISDFLISLVQPGNYQLSFTRKQFIPYFLLAVVLVPIQTSAEELLFRGYLTQAIGLISHRLWLPIIIPAVLFGLLHGMNPEVDTYGFWIMIAYYIGMGLLLGWITLRSQGLELALGLHFINNLYGTLIVTYPDSAIRSPALYTLQYFDPITGLIAFLIMAMVYILVISLLIRLDRNGKSSPITEKRGNL